MIEEFSGVCSDALSTLLDIYQMKSWDMTWEKFLAQFTEEMLAAIEKWKNEEINQKKVLTNKILYDIIQITNKERR